MLRRTLPLLVAALLLALPGSVLGAGTPAFSGLLEQGIAARAAGDLNESIGILRQAAGQAATPADRTRSAAELGTALLQARQFEAAEAVLTPVYLAASGPDRAELALLLGNMAHQRSLPELAAERYREAIALAGPASATGVRAALNGVLRQPPASIPTLEALFAAIERSGASADVRAGLYLSLAHQARRAGTPALSYRALERAQHLAGSAAARLLVEIGDARAQLYEDAGRSAEALTLTHQALAMQAAPDLAIPLETRLGRLYAAQGQGALSLAAYQRAIVHVEALRPDIPIEFDDGTSSFRSWFEPVYLGLAAGLIDAAAASPAQSQAYLRRARDAVELIKQSELQDYLNDRCTVDAVKGGSATVIPPGTAVLYTVILDQRVELLLETAAGIRHFRSAVSGVDVRSNAGTFAAELRGFHPDFLVRAQRLYDWLLRPVEAALAADRIDTLVIVPDGALRLVPFGALHDGQRFAIDRMAIATVTGMSMTNTTPPAAASYNALVAGASQFGPVVARLLETKVGQRMDAQLASRQARVLAPGRRLRSISGDNPAPVTEDRTERLREALALPGVASEIARVSALLGASAILDDQFTVTTFSGAVQQESHGIVHLASHGVFGGSSASSFLLAYDDLLTLDGLQGLLRSERLRRSPIELLTLSACETADGNERAPLGMSGAAMKARAKSVLGALWPVDDQAAVTLMTGFYTGIKQGKISKAQSLRSAQQVLKQQPDLAHPGFWAPFTLIGNWQ